MKIINAIRLPAFSTALLLLVIASVWFVARPANASLGNAGVPVRCEASPLAGYRFMKCTAADGTAFTDNERVPAGRYFMITDVIVKPIGSAVEVVLYDASGTVDRSGSLRLRREGVDSFEVQFATPYFVLPAGHRLEVYSNGPSGNAYVYVSGLLVTNVMYLPQIQQ